MNQETIGSTKSVAFSPSLGLCAYVNGKLVYRVNTIPDVRRVFLALAIGPVALGKAEFKTRQEQSAVAKEAAAAFEHLVQGGQ